jgi:hypothetical protein
VRKPKQERTIDESGVFAGPGTQIFLAADDTKISQTLPRNEEALIWPVLI